MEEKNIVLTEDNQALTFENRIESKCGNCHTLLETSNRFCSDCGAKVIDNRFTMKFLFSEMKENLFSLDSSRPLRTFIHLFTQPEEVIGGYISGIRKKYINAFGYFTIAVTLSSFFYFVVLKFFPDAFDSIATSSNLTEEQIEMQRSINKTTFEYQSLLFFGSIPFFALISRLIFLKNKRYNYAEHLIINLYTYSQISIVTILIYFATIWSPTLFGKAVFSVLGIQIVYYAFVLKRMYSLSLKQILLKVLLFFAIVGPIVIVLGILLFIIFIITGVVDFEQMVEAEKAKRAVSYMASSVMNWTS